MFKHWLTLTLRHSGKYRLFTFINIFSLAVGLSCSLAILLFIQDELAYDKFHQHASRIARITTTTSFNGTENLYSRTPVPLADHLKSALTGVSSVGRVTMREVTLFIPSKQTKALERNFYFADPEVLKIFTFGFQYGNSSTALKDAGSVILTESIAKKYFGSVSASIGQSITIENELHLTVSGVIKDWPLTSHLHPEIITHFDNYVKLESEGVREFLQSDWLYSSVLTYVLLNDTDDLSATVTQVNEIRKRQADERVSRSVSYDLQPLTDIHLHSNFSYEGGGAIRYVYIFGTVGIMLLLIACFNFINLSIARSLKRYKEIGMKKALGMNRSSIVIQLLGESMMYVGLAMALAALLTYLILPTINSITEKHLTMLSLFTPGNSLAVIVILLVTGVLSGWYPAVHVAGIDTYKALKGQIAGQSGKFQLRKLLVVLQFFVAISLVLFTLFVNRQLTFMKRQPLGFEQKYMLTIPLFSSSFNSIIGTRIDGDYRQRMIAFEETVLQNPRIEAITCSSFLPGQGAVAALIQTDSLTESSNVFIPTVSVDYDFIETYNIRILEGRGFSRAFGTDHLQAFIVNEAAVKQLGFKSIDQAIGQRLAAVGKNGLIVGVINNYHIQGLQFAMQPLILEAAAHKFSTFSVRLNNTDIPASIAALKKAWDIFFPESIFEYTFLEEQLQDNYANEQRLAQVIGYFSIFTYVIAGLGLFGLAAYINEQRAREVGIRKVLGATTVSILFTLASAFLKLILIAIAIAVPVAAYIITTWLEGFHYKVDLDIYIFIAVVIGTFAIALVTILYQTVRSASTNPAEVLRSE